MTAKGIVPKRINTADVRKNILQEMNRQAKFVQGEFNKTTASWKQEKPTFKIEDKSNGNDLIINIVAAGNEMGVQKWIWLNDGTRPHPIKAKNVPNLVFRTNFTPKTKVKTFSSGSGSISPPWRATPEVNHPGTEARDWTGEMVKILEKRLPIGIIKAVELR